MRFLRAIFQKAPWLEDRSVCIGDWNITIEIGGGIQYVVSKLTPTLKREDE